MKKRPQNDSTITLDLHGKTRDEATDLLEHAIDRAILKNAWKLEVIHGKGSGAVKGAVHDYLRRSAHISKFELDAMNPGTTWVYF